MSPLLWLQRLFAPKENEENSEQAIDEEESRFTFNEHMRIVLAMVIVIVSALVMWWILM